jgi:hypothetical protein
MPRGPLQVDVTCGLPDSARLFVPEPLASAFVSFLLGFLVAFLTIASIPPAIDWPQSSLACM